MREKPRNPVSVTKTSSPLHDGHPFGVGAATGGDRVSASGKDGRTPAMPSIREAGALQVA